MKGKPRKYFFTPEMDEEIKRLYLNEVGMKAVAYTGPVKKLAQKWGIPRWKVSVRARELGILPMQKKEPNWSPKELDILERNPHRTPSMIQKYLKKAGYHRTLQGIMLKKRRTHLTRSTMDGYTARSLAECFGIDAHSITRWIKKGWLKAMKRGTARKAQQGGDEYYIRDSSIRDFIIRYVAIIDFRKIDKYWLVDLLTEGKYGFGRIDGKMDMEESGDMDSQVLDIFSEAQTG